MVTISFKIRNNQNCVFLNSKVLILSHNVNFVEISKMQSDSFQQASKQKIIVKYFLEIQAK
jgi:hypothetical protein